MVELEQPANGLAYDDEYLALQREGTGGSRLQGTERLVGSATPG